MSPTFDGSFEYLSNVGDIELGYRGDVILVNGTVAPHLELRRQHTRLRILMDQMPAFTHSAVTTAPTSSSLLRMVVYASALCAHAAWFGPGERIELLFDMEPNRTVTLMSYPSDSGRME